MHTNFAEIATYTAILQSAAVKETSMRSKTVSSLGFTLVELMITVAIVGIVASLAVPSFQDMLNQNRASSLANELASSLNLARSEAIKRGTQVSVCKSANITASSPTCSTTANWQNGWLIFVDKSTSGTFDGTDTPLKVGQPSNNNAVITAAPTFTNYISYLPSGMSKGSGLPNGSLDICVNHIARSIIINTTGRNRFSKGTC
jgi:type IV fimbrial biogenesis protein FimT